MGSQTPVTTPAISRKITQLATEKSMKPFCRLPTLPDDEAAICNAWLAAMVGSAGKPSAIIMGTESTGRPTTARPLAKPTAAPITKIYILLPRRADTSPCMENGLRDRRAERLAKMMMPARIRFSVLAEV